MSESTELRMWSFVSLLVGGILIVVGGLMGAVMMGAYGWSGMMGGMMGAYMSDAWVANMSWWMGGIGLVTGALVLVASGQVLRGREVALWGVVAIAAGALSLFAMGGYLLGAIGAIAGGALALVDQQQNTQRARGA